MSLETLVPLSAFLAIALGIWGALSFLATGSSDAEQRLRRMTERSQQRRSGGKLVARERERFQDKIAKAASRLAAPMQPKNEAQVGKLREELFHAGFRHPQAVQFYLGIRILCLLVGLAIAVPPVISSIGLTGKGLLYIAGGGALGYYLPSIVLGQIKKRRQEAIFIGLPDALDLMVVCVESGLGLDAAMRRVTTELVDSCPVLCDEFNIANFQVQMGRARKDVWRELGLRTGVDDVRALAAVIIQAEKFGSSIGAALRVQSDSMRVRRRQLAEERAAKTAVKIMIPLILFIFPGVFIVLVGPAGIQIANTLMK